MRAGVARNPAPVRYYVGQRVSPFNVLAVRREKAGRIIHQRTMLGRNSDAVAALHHKKIALTFLSEKRRIGAVAENHKSRV